MSVIRHILLAVASLSIVSGSAFGQAPAPLANTVMFPTLGAPPISAGPVTVVNGHLSCAGQRCAFFGFNFTSYTLYSTLTGNSKGVFPYPANRVVLCAQLDNFARMGCNVIRFNDLDVGTGANWWCAGNGPMTQTLTPDPVQAEAFDYVFAQCKARNLRVVLTLYQAHQLQPADTPTWTCTCFNEMLGTAYDPPSPPIKGSPWPWMLFDKGVLQYSINFANRSCSTSTNTRVSPSGRIRHCWP